MDCRRNMKDVLMGASPKDFKTLIVGVGSKVCIMYCLYVTFFDVRRNLFNDHIQCICYILRRKRGTKISDEILWNEVSKIGYWKTNIGCDFVSSLILTQFQKYGMYDYLLNQKNCLQLYTLFMTCMSKHMDI